MKKRLLFVSLFLISILFISSCVQESGRRSTAYPCFDENGNEIDCFEEKILSIEGSVQDLDKELSSLSLFNAKLPDGTTISTDKNLEICDCNILKDCGTDWKCSPGEQLIKYEITVEVPSSINYDEFGRITLNEQDSARDISRAKEKLNEILELGEFGELLTNTGKNVGEIQEKINHPEFENWLIGKVSDEEFKKVDWCYGCGSSGPGTCYNWCISGSGNFNWVCFSGNTDITMSDNSEQKIENLKVGEFVKSFNPKTNKFVTSEVKNVYVAHSKENLLINGLLEVTSEHPFYTDGRWVEAKNLKVGDNLLTSDNKNLRVTSIDKIKKESEVYNLEVGGPNTFYANNLLVHNKAFIKSARITYTIWLW